ncbi:MAG: penicillin-binding protein activator [Xanthomonadaceae bacterium]|nr:penicillin-binding protein activator [Xanthomonadaceae bacterium]
MILLATGCGPGSLVRTSPMSTEQASAIALLEQGQPEQAAAMLENQAALAKTAGRRMPLQADAAFAWREAGDDARARALAAQVDPRRLTGPSQSRFALMSAEWALTDGRPAAALAALVDGGETIPSGLLTRWHLARAQALEVSGNAFAAAGERARADTDLGGQALRDNRNAIERLLSSLDDTTLTQQAAALPMGDPLYNFVGRTLLRRGLALPRQFDRGEQWRFDTGGRPPADRDGYRPPVKLAVLLPLSGSLAQAAAPVRDGLLAGYYAEARQRPEMQFYDTTGTADGALHAYNQAVESGADFVVGPLGRDEVTALFNQPTLSTPVLALNRGEVPPPPGNAGFALAPEDDGIAAAEYLLGRERRNVVIIAGSDDNAKRSTQAFTARFTERGGQIAATLELGDAPGDVSARLTSAAGAGADAVFLAVRGPQARLLAPQLALSGLAGVTRVGTSQLASGTGRADEDAALDGIVYPTETWTTRGTSSLPSASATADMLPTARGAAARLFAFGHDAWQITAYLERLANSANNSLQGATGILHLDGFGNIVRTPSWATFNSGIPTPIYDGG